MTIDLFTAMQQLNSVNGGNTVDNSTNEVVQNNSIGTAQPLGANIGQPVNNNVQPLGANIGQPVNSNIQPFGTNTMEQQVNTAQPLGNNTMEQQVNNTQPLGANIGQPVNSNVQPLGANIGQPVNNNIQPLGANTIEQPANSNTQPLGANTPDQTNTTSQQMLDFMSNGVSLPQQLQTATPVDTTEKKADTKKASSKKKSKDKKEENSVYVYERDIEMSVKYGGIERFKMPLKLELHGMDEFEYIKNRLAEMGVTAAKMENFVIEEQDDYFRLIKVAREQKRYHSKG